MNSIWPLRKGVKPTAQCRDGQSERGTGDRLGPTSERAVVDPSNVNFETDDAPIARVVRRIRGGRRWPPNHRLDAPRLFLATLVVLSLVAGGLLVVGFSTVEASGTESVSVSSSGDDVTLVESSTATAPPNLPEDEEPPDENDVVVDLDQDHVVTESTANRTPPDPYVTVDGELLLVDEHDDYDLNVVQTAEDGDVPTVEGGDYDGEPIKWSRDESDLFVLGERGTIAATVEVDRDTGLVQTTDGDAITLDGDQLEYEEYEDVNLEPELTNVTDVDEGETLTVEADVRNTNWADADEDVALNVPGVTGDDEYPDVTESVSIDGGEETNVTFEHTTTEGYFTADAVEVETTDNVASESIDIGASGAAVDITDTTPAMEGEEIEVEAEIDRFGDYPSGNQTYPIALFVDGDEVDTETIYLEPGDETTTTFTYETESGDADSVDVSVQSRTDTSSTDVEVVSHRSFQENVSTEITNYEMGDIDNESGVTAEFEYHGDFTDGQTDLNATLLADGQETDSETVTLDGSSTEGATFSHNRTSGEPPVSTLAVETETSDDAVYLDNSTEVAILDVTNPATRGEEIEATIGIENTGEAPGRHDLSTTIDTPFAVDGDGTYNRSIPLNASERHTQDVSFDLRENTPSTLELEAAVGHDGDAETIEVRDNESHFEVTDVRTNETDNDTMEVVATVWNAGGADDSQTVELVVDDEVVHTETVALDVDEEATISTEIAKPDETTTLDALTEDDTETETVAGAVEPDGSSALSTPSLPSLGWFSIVILVLFGALVVLSAIYLYREGFDPDDIRRDLGPDRIRRDLDALLGQGLFVLGRRGTVVVQNTLPREATVRVRVRTDDDVVFLDDFTLDPNEARRFSCLPSTTEFEVGSGVDDITTHQEVFGEGTDKVGILLQPKGIMIGEY